MRTIDEVNVELLKLFDCRESDIASHKNGILSEHQVQAITFSSSDFKAILLALALSVVALTLFIVAYEASPKATSSSEEIEAAPEDWMFQRQVEIVIANSNAGDIDTSNTSFGAFLLLLIICSPFIIVGTGLWMYLRPKIVGTVVYSERGLIKTIRRDDDDLGELFYLKVNNRTFSIERNVFNFLELFGWKELIADVFYLPSVGRVVSLEIVEVMSSSKSPDIIHL